MLFKKVKKMFTGVAQTLVYPVNFSPEGIMGLTSVFDFKNIITHFCAIEQSSPFFERIAQSGFKYMKYKSHPKSNTPYFDAILAVPAEGLEKLLKIAFEYDIEIILCQSLMEGINNNFSWDKYAYEGWGAKGKSILNGVSDVCFNINMDEDIVAIVFSTKVYDKKEINAKIRNI